MLDEDLRQLLRAILVVIGAILPIVNPVGSAPMFLAMTHGADSTTRRNLAGIVAVNSFILLLASLIFGNFVLRLFGVSWPLVQLPGGHASCGVHGPLHRCAIRVERAPGVDRGTPVRGASGRRCPRRASGRPNRAEQAAVTVELRHFLEGVFLVFAALLPIVNPLGAA